MIDHLPVDDERFDAILYSSDQIATRIQEMANQIHHDLGDPEEICLVGILKGVCPFQMDMARALSANGMRHIRFGFLRASTYGDGIKANGETERKVKITNVAMPKATKHIILMDDVLDQGFTLAAVRSWLAETYPGAEIRTAVMLKKNVKAATTEVQNLRAAFAPDYIGFQAPDRWVVGYGLDIAEDFRELPYIATVYEKYFQN